MYETETEINKCEHILVAKGFETKCVVQKQNGILPRGGFCTASVLTDQILRRLQTRLLFLFIVFFNYLLSLNAHTLSFYYNSNLNTL